MNGWMDGKPTTPTYKGLSVLFWIRFALNRSALCCVAWDGTLQGVRRFCEGLRAWKPDLFQHTDFKITDGLAESMVFKAFTLRKTDELVAYGLAGEKVGLGIFFSSKPFVCCLPRRGETWDHVVPCITTYSAPRTPQSTIHESVSDGVAFVRIFYMGSWSLGSD